MPVVDLDLKALHQFSEKALGRFFNRVAVLLKRPLNREEVRQIYREGARLMVTGDALYSAPELNYAFFLEKASWTLPLKLTARCFSSVASSHTEIMYRGDTDMLIAVGTLIRGHFDNFSSTWQKGAPLGSGEYYLGTFINSLILEYYSVPLTAQPSLSFG